MKSYIDEKKKLYTTILEFLENSNDQMNEKYFEMLSTIFKNQAIGEDREEMQDFLQIIKKISDNHHRDPSFIAKTKLILQHFKIQIKQTLSNDEIFHLFEDNKLLVLFLIENDIIKMTETICEEMMKKIESNGNRYCHFFYPELEHFLGEEKMKDVKNELLIKFPTAFENYETKRQQGENESLICLMIRNDSVEDFISYVTHKNYSLSSQITPSIFETNLFLIKEENTTFIEYSAFFGSIQIFQYLMMNKVELKPSLWLYVIHSKNPEMIEKLKENIVSPPLFEDEEFDGEFYPNDKYLMCLTESIKCHHKDFADHFKIMFQDEKELNQNEQFISAYMKYHNYEYFEAESIKDHGFFYLHYYHYHKLADLLLKMKEKIIEEAILQGKFRNDVEIIYVLLSKRKEIPNNFFRNDIDLRQIVIPSSITSIGDLAFCDCSSLTQVFIPSSVTSIGKRAFDGCSSLKQIIIPNSITSIGKNAFFDCPFNNFYKLAKQLLDNPNQQKNVLSILNSISFNAPDGELENILEIASKFLFNENEEIRIQAFKLIDRLIMRTLDSNELNEQISSLIIKYSNYLFELNKNDKESEKFINKIKEYISGDIELSSELICIVEKVEQMIDDRKIPIDFRIKCFPLIEASYNLVFELDNSLLPKILQLTLEVCENDRLDDRYLFSESFFKQYPTNNEPSTRLYSTDSEYSIKFFKENIEKLFESKKLCDHQVALLLIKVLIISISLEDCVKYIDLVLKIGDCEDESIIHHCITVFSDLIDDFNESLVIKFNQISEFLLKNKNSSGSLITLSKLIKSVNKTPDYFTNIIDSLLLNLKSQEKVKSTDILKCINSCFSSGITLISPFDKPSDSATKVFEMIIEKMNSNEFEFELPILLKILGNLVFYSPEHIKNNLDKIINICLLSLKNSNASLESIKCIRNIATCLPESILPYLSVISKPMLNFIKKIRPEMLEDLDNTTVVILYRYKIVQCICQFGLTNDEFAEKYGELLWESFNNNSEYFVLASSSANFFAKRGFPIDAFLDKILDILIRVNNSDLSSYLKAIQRLILALTKEQISSEELFATIGNTLIGAGSGTHTNFLISESITIIPDKIYRKLFNCLLAYVDIYQKKISSQFDYFIDGLKMELLNTSKLSCVQFLHFLTKILMICGSEINDEVIKDIFFKVLLNFEHMKDKKIIDTEKFAHVLISLIYLLRTKKELFNDLKQKENLSIESLMKIDSNDNFEFIIIRQTFILNFVMLLELPIDDVVKKILNEIKFIKNLEVIPLLADCFIYIFKIIRDEILPMMKKFATVVFSSEKYVLELIDEETLKFYGGLMKSIKQEELLSYTNSNELSIHQIAFNMKTFST